MPFKSGKLLLVRLDGIGDYVLFRNFIQILKQNNKWKHYKITLLGNKLFKDLAEGLEKDWIDEFIWIDLQSLKKYYFLASLSLRLKLKSFDILINPTHSRIPFYDQFLTYAGCKFLIGNEGDDFYFKDQNAKDVYDKFYDQLIPSISVHHFEFCRNKHFFDILLNQNIDIKLSLVNKQSGYVSASNYNIVIFPGAGLAYRQWSPANFACLILLIAKADSRNKHFYIVGGESDTTISKKILAAVDIKNITDLTGKTSVLEMTDLIGSADLLISNETSAVHIAAATETSTVCISNGNHFGRFNPYPNSLTRKIQTVYPDSSFYTTDEVEQNLLVEKYKYKSDLNINLIEPHIVFEIASRLMDT